MLEVDDLVVRYGAATALDGVSLRIEQREMVALVGPNGAGKSTLLNTLSGILRPAAGRMRVEGRLAQVPEGRQLFPDLTVEDNLRLGAWRSGDRDPGRVYRLFPGLMRLRRHHAGTLSGGEQQMVAVGRALMSDPDILAVDELSLGLAPLVVADLVRHLRMLNEERGMAILLVEQNARLAFDICGRAYIIEAGRVVASGSCAELANSPEVQRAYLGGSTDEYEEYDESEESEETTR
ncbi:MAG: ATP-binding cassette domain-containing protein [Streptosporangiales bacterium]|nr:ATP-binding cassette domain-containing protein [Streptosporangiales bacterium]